MLLNCGRRLLRAPWTARRSNQSILKEISPEYALEGLILKLPIIWPPNAKNWLIGKDSDAGKDWRQEEKGKTEDEMVRYHHQFHEHEFEQTPGNSEGQGYRTCCGPWRRKESDVTERLNWLNWRPSEWVMNTFSLQIPQKRKKGGMLSLLSFWCP